MGFADRLRQATADLHRRAENSGVIRDLLRGTASRGAYALLLRSLVPVYCALERGFARQPALADAAPGLRQAAALELDLVALSGTSWDRSLELLPAAKTYAERVEAAAEGDGLRLLSHAYVRYFGDLNGGRIVRRVLVRSLGLSDSALNFCTFPEIDDVATFVSGYRRAFDRVARRAGEGAHLIEEAMTAFELNIAVSEAVRTAGAAGDRLHCALAHP